MDAKTALLQLVPALSEDDAERLLAFAQDLFEGEPLSDEEHAELLDIKAAMLAGDAEPWDAIKRQLDL